MIKIKALKLSKLYYILFISLYVVIFYNFLFIDNKITNNSNLDFFSQFSYIFSEVLLAILTLILFLILFSFSNILLKLWTIIFIILNSIFSYYIVFYQVFIDEMLIGAIFETSTDEASAIVGIGIFLWAIIFGILPSLYIIFFVKIKKYNFNALKEIHKVNKEKIIIVIKKLIKFLPLQFIILAFLLIYLLSPSLLSEKKLQKSALAFYMPMNYVASIYQYIYFLKDTDISNIEDISKKHPFTFSKKFQDKPLNIILILGESSRAMNHSLNGYKRNTNPYTSQINNFISFPNVSSCGTLSRYSISCLLSYKGRKEFSFPILESNLISAFNSIGFYTSFISNQPINDSSQNAFYLASLDAKKRIFNNIIKQSIPSGEDIYDEHLLPFLQKIKQENHKHKLIVVYLLGSHFSYQDRYPKEFEIFTPTCNKGIKRCNDIEKNYNAYDNSIIYTDYIIKEIIEEFKTENSFLFYISDHGQYLGENGKYFHGGSFEEAGKELINVAQFIWGSPSLINLMEGRYQNIVDKKELYLSQDSIFHSLFDCFGITSSLVKKELSLCN